VNKWREELKALRSIVLESAVIEELKWGVPCYTSANKNIVIVSAFKEYACIGFFKGALLEDKEKILVKQGVNSNAVRIVKYTNIEEINKQAGILKLYIEEAIDIEMSGRKPEPKNNPEPIPEELRDEFSNDFEFERAFCNLTPGRQRVYILYFSQAKNPGTKMNRIKKCRQNILNGLGLNE
jgi:uncharacterized protein YdeI (YjbR/CyaY-like superfamily)